MRTRFAAFLVLPVVVTGLCSCAPHVSPAAEIGSGSAAASPPAPEFTEPSERELTEVYRDSFDDNSGDWIEPDSPGNTITDGVFRVEESAGQLFRWLGNVPYALMPLEEARFTATVATKSLTSLGVYCRVDRSFTAFYRLSLEKAGTYIRKAELDETTTILFEDSSRTIPSDFAGTLTFDCFQEDDGYHLQIALDGAVIAQAVDAEAVPAGGDFTLTWQNDIARDRDPPYVLELDELVIEVPAP
ncbi:MAG TPA: hypothetical protein VEX88_00145 [Glaciibacter sp.]|nr:hypothetical protein [Glaciibacter sp.]